MSLQRPLRGACDCGRNRYTIEAPRGATDFAQVIFNTESIHQAALGPLASFLRVPLDWLSTSTFAYFDDETHSKIRRVYSNPLHSHSKRYFCGYCGTSISYWTEEPRSEADYISLTLGSLLREDLLLLDNLGLIQDGHDSIAGTALASLNGEDVVEESKRSTTSTNEPGQSRRTTNADQTTVRQEPTPIPEPISESPSITVITSEEKAQAPITVRQSMGVPWFDALITDSGLGRLGNMRRTVGSSQSRDGRVRQEWTIYEWSAGEGNDEDDSGIESDEPMPGLSTIAASTKRKRDDDQQRKVAVRKANTHDARGDAMDQSED